MYSDTCPYKQYPVWPVSGRTYRGTRHSCTASYCLLRVHYCPLLPRYNTVLYPTATLKYCTSDCHKLQYSTDSYCLIMQYCMYCSLLSRYNTVLFPAVALLYTVQHSTAFYCHTTIHCFLQTYRLQYSTVVYCHTTIQYCC
jgi:hypothetical protein